MSERRSHLPDSLGRTFSRAQALDLGASASRLRAADLEIPFRGVRSRVVRGEPQGAAGLWIDVPGEAERPSEAFDAGSRHPNALWAAAQRVRAAKYLPIMGPDEFFTGRTAAALWRLPVPSSGSADIHVGVLMPRSPPRRSGVRGARHTPGHVEVVEVGGVRVLSPASVWLVVGPILDDWDRVALGDQVVRAPRVPGGSRPPPRMPYSTIEALAEDLRLPRRRGRAALLSALPLLRTGAASPPETHTRLALLGDRDLPEFELDYDVRDDAGRFLGCSEIAFVEYRLAVEYEGDRHRVDREQWNRDIEKYRAYEEAGWGTVRVTSEKLYRRVRDLRAQVRRSLVDRGWAPP